jgi:ornithine cyclodeaminase/alanine dehydrogenase-like protein (mu-crystallin family)
VIRDHDVRDQIDLPRLVSRIEEGDRADAAGGVVTFPRQRREAQGTTLAWLGAALPSLDLLAFRSYVYGADGADRGHQVAALYGHSDMGLRALFVGRLVGNLRTGAAIAAALHLVEPGAQELGRIGTGYQTRNALACIAATIRPSHVVAWSPTREHREGFRSWATSALGVPVDLADSAGGVLQRAASIGLVTASEEPVVTSDMLSEPRLLLSISGYRRPEIDLPILDAARCIGTDRVERASAPVTLFERNERRAKLRPLAAGLEDRSILDGRATRILLNTGAPWEEAVVAQGLFELAVARNLGTELELPTRPDGNGAFQRSAAPHGAPES